MQRSAFGSYLQSESLPSQPERVRCCVDHGDGEHDGSLGCWVQAKAAHRALDMAVYVGAVCGGGSEVVGRAASRLAACLGPPGGSDA